MGYDPDEYNCIAPPQDESHRSPCPRHAFTTSGGVLGRMQPSPQPRPKQGGGANGADGENNSPGQQSKTLPGRGERMKPLWCV